MVSQFGDAASAGVLPSLGHGQSSEDCGQSEERTDAEGAQHEASRSSTRKATVRWSRTSKSLLGLPRSGAPLTLFAVEGAAVDQPLPPSRAPGEQDSTLPARRPRSR